jgi:hypothetical protein
MSSGKVSHISALFQLKLDYLEILFIQVSNKKLHGNLSNESSTGTGGRTDRQTDKHEAN